MEIRINKPCSENWEAMTMGEGCRFCASCQKNVIDFTGKSREEIEQYLLAKKGDRTCGRFMQSQLEPRYSCAPVIIRPSIYQRSGLNPPVWLMAATSLLLAACENTPKNLAPANPVKTEIRSADTIKKDSIELENLPPAGMGYSTPQIILVEPDRLEPIDPESIPYDLVIGEVEYDPERPLHISEVRPEYPGGEDNLKAYLVRTLVYPLWEKENGIQGKVIARFVIDKTGKPRDFEILRSVKDSRNFDAEVLRVLQAMPDWTPGKQNGQNVNAYSIIPITFELPSDSLQSPK